MAPSYTYGAHRGRQFPREDGELSDTESYASDPEPESPMPETTEYPTSTTELTTTSTTEPDVHEVRITMPDPLVDERVDERDETIEGMERLESQSPQVETGFSILRKAMNDLYAECKAMEGKMMESYETQRKYDSIYDEHQRLLAAKEDLVAENIQLKRKIEEVEEDSNRYKREANIFKRYAMEAQCMQCGKVCTLCTGCNS
jgi:hypothetical protein